MSKLETIIFDVDGTLANLEHRLHFINGPHKDYESFFNALDKDAPITEVIDILRALYFSGVKILVVSGRPDSHLRETQLWFNKHGVVWHKMYMRKAGDYRPDDIVKKEILAQILAEGHWDIKGIFDDRQRVVDMWRKEGYRVYQVAPGDFDKPKYRGETGKLILLVGPSGAGKSTYVENNFNNEVVVSSDKIRETLCGDFQDQSKNAQVFNALHSIVQARIEHGLLTVVDATNIRAADRKAILTAVPEQTAIEYHIINRPLPEKLRDGGWRLNVDVKGIGLIEKHEQVFNSNLKYILNGDGDPRVKVIDMRGNI